jgi:lysophospholipase L1-like esterase
LVHTPTFQTSYVNLLHEVRAKYPGAVIFALETFSKRFAAQTQAAVATVNAAGDANVSYVNTEGWLASNQFSDSVHPNDSGHRTVADHLAPIISARIGAWPGTGPSALAVPAGRGRGPRGTIPGGSGWFALARSS